MIASPCPGVRPGEECILPIVGNWPDRPFDDVGVDLDPAIVDEVGLRNNLRLLIVAPFATTVIACEHLKPAYRLILGFKRKF
jgi:hypothetical protein